MLAMNVTSPSCEKQSCPANSIRHNHRVNFAISFLCPLVAATLVVVGCKREEVREYSAPKEGAVEPQPALPSGHPDIAGGQKELPPTPKINWAKLPDGWTEKPASAMRSASFAVADMNGHVADVSAIPLPAPGQEVELVNMWRQQMQLPPLNSSDVPAESVTIGTEQGKLFDMASETPIIEGKSKGRIIVAMLTRGETSWFFKIAGEEKFVAAQKSVFMEFLKGVSFPEATLVATQTAASPVVPDAAAGLPAWTAPANWQSQPPGQMLLAKFAIAGENSGKAAMTVSSFPGDVGGTLANVNRWRKQLGLGAVTDGDLGKLISTVETGGGTGSLVDMTGTAARTVGVMLPRGGQMWFFKLMGDDAVVAHEKDAFLTFLKSLKF